MRKQLLLREFGNNEKNFSFFIRLTISMVFTNNLFPETYCMLQVIGIRVMIHPTGSDDVNVWFRFLVACSPMRNPFTDVDISV